MGTGKKIIFGILISTVFFSCGTETNNEDAVQFRINNDSSYDLENISISAISLDRFEDFFIDENKDTTSFQISFVPSFTISENSYEIPDNTAFLEMQMLVDGEIFPAEIQTVRDTTAGGDFMTLEGTYTLRFEDQYLYDNKDIIQDNSSSEGIWIRVLNNSQTNIEELELTLDQELPEDPQSAVSRSQIDRKVYTFTSLDDGEWSEYVTTDLLFNQPRGFKVTARNQTFSKYNFDFEEFYFYEDKTPLEQGYYTLEINSEGTRLRLDNLYKD